MADRSAAARPRHPTTPRTAAGVTTDEALEHARELAVDVPPGPWRHYRSHDGALIIEDMVTGEPIAQVYAGLPAARYLEALAPAQLLETDR
jgi:hypothetical protein